MKQISPAVRISFGLIMFTVSVILFADLAGVIPKRNVMMIELRQKVTENLAVQLSIAASYSQFGIIKSSLDVFVSRNDDVIAASMSKMNGVVVAEFGEFINFSSGIDNTSSENSVIVPIFAGDKQWGMVNVEYKSLYDVGFMAYLQNSIAGLLLIVSFGCFFGFLIILKRSLAVLDPKNVMPERVCAAFNTLSEGVLILDDKEQIMMANKAFADNIKKTPDELLGVNMESMKWKHMSREARHSSEKMPWVGAIEQGEKHVGVALNLSSRGSGVRLFSTNTAPIQDDKGNIKGALVTFDDVTGVDETNVLLENAVTTLRENELEIKRKNEELEVLATRDPLTGCYNRRAFFNFFEIAFEKAQKHNTPITTIMSDIDLFKSVNDNFGHSVGDEVIRLVSGVLNDVSVKGALVGRYGGEEFCLVLPGIDADEAFKISNQLRKTIENSSHGLCEPEHTVTSSFGLVCNDIKVSSCSEMLDLADKALYQAKQTGRNKVVQWKLEFTELDEQGSNDEDKSKEKINDDKRDITKEFESDVLQKELRSYSKNNLIDKDQIIDPITQLPSKLIFVDRVCQAMKYAQRTNKLMSVATFNIDKFSRINEAMGKAVGDEFLKAIGQRLNAILRSSDTVASILSTGQSTPSFSRLMADDFALLLTGVKDIESLTYIIQRIQSKFEGKITVAGNEIFVTTSIGMAVYPQDGDTPDVLIDNSSRAQKQAKNIKDRSNFQFYSQDVNRVIIDQIQVEIDLHHAIEQNQFVLYYQPKLDLKTKSITSMEALIRWKHPTKGMVFPDGFIPIAEKTGMIVGMGNWCMQNACKQTKKWVDMGAKDIRTAVNISAFEFTHSGFKDNVALALKESELDARNLEIEITETTFMENQDVANTIIEDLRFMGVTVTLDDFGTGYSSLCYFGNLEMDWLKIDRSFLLEAMDKEKSKIIYSSIVKMAHDTGVRVVAEGIETQEQFTFISRMGVDEMQGYLYSKPLSAESMMTLLFSDIHKS
ncbi:diguanylate cyclase/phosphodiesterase (GGDEF & EAL domains) with PAS/PAC sensor(s) [hydrothermal vent metagenome]|uniref:Diguanylate cyclase/phosphodiesterase (GGDEF & EAL domains) with PAS/PAC sensor(S) n=1 Tax=hydrothermal vent metagenome TaxID=652676 RepID=A0A3B0XL39_9ZZZZ